MYCLIKRYGQPYIVKATDEGFYSGVYTTQWELDDLVVFTFISAASVLLTKSADVRGLNDAERLAFYGCDLSDMKVLAGVHRIGYQDHELREDW